MRRHFSTNLPWIMASIIMATIPVILAVFSLLSFLPSEFQVIAVLGWYLITLAYSFERFLSWFFNVNIVTDERVVDIDFHNLFYKEVTDTNTEMIQDVTYTTGGFIRTFFKYGNVKIQTASEKQNIEFLAIPNPARIVKILQELRIEEEIEKLEGRIR